MAIWRKPIQFINVMLANRSPMSVTVRGPGRMTYAKKKIKPFAEHDLRVTLQRAGKNARTCGLVYSLKIRILKPGREMHARISNLRNQARKLVRKEPCQARENSIQRNHTRGNSNLLFKRIWFSSFVSYNKSISNQPVLFHCALTQILNVSVLLL